MFNKLLLCANVLKSLYDLKDSNTILFREQKLTTQLLL